MTLATAFLSLLTSVDPAGLAAAVPAPAPPAPTMIEATVEEAGTNAHELTPTDAALTLIAADAATVPTGAPAEPATAAPDTPATAVAAQLALDLDGSAASPTVEASPPSASVQLAFAFQDEVMCGSRAAASSSSYVCGRSAVIASAANRAETNAS